MLQIHLVSRMIFFKNMTNFICADMCEIEIKKVAEKALKTADNLGIATEKAKGIALKAKEKVSENVSDNSESPVNYAIVVIIYKIAVFNFCQKKRIIRFKWIKN